MFNNIAAKIATVVLGASLSLMGVALAYVAFHTPVK